MTDEDSRALPNGPDTSSLLSSTANLTVEEILDNFRLRQKMGLTPDSVIQLEPSREDTLRLYRESVKAYEELYGPGGESDQRIRSPTAGQRRGMVSASPSSPASILDDTANSAANQRRGSADSELPSLYAELNTVRRDKAALEKKVSSLTESQMVLNNQRRLLSDQLETARAQAEQTKAENARLKVDIEVTAMKVRRREANGHESVLARAVDRSSNSDDGKLEFYREQMSILARENQRLKSRLSSLQRHPS